MELSFERDWNMVDRKNVSSLRSAEKDRSAVQQDTGIINIILISLLNSGNRSQSSLFFVTSKITSLVSLIGIFLDKYLNLHFFQHVFSSTFFSLWWTTTVFRARQ